MQLLKRIQVLMALLLTSSLFAQEQQPAVEMADAMHANGKIYVVVTVVSVILTGILTYLIIIDRRLRKLEKAKKKE